MSGFFLHVQNLFKLFPRQHLIVVTTITTLIILALSINTHTDLEQTTQIPLSISLPTIAKADKQTKTTKPEQTDHYHWQKLTIGKGDTLSSIFQRAKIPARQMFLLLNSNKDSKRLTKLKPGEVIYVAIKEGKLVALKYAPDALTNIIYQLKDKKFVNRKAEREPHIRIRFAKAKVSSSLFLAAQDAGLSQSIIMELADVFAGVMDFVYDPRKGDTFSVLYEELYLDDKKYKNGNILAAQYINDGDTLNAFRYQDKKGNTGYYNEKGVSMRKTFLRAPVDFTRISSSFNLRRLHPVFKTRRPHRGIDYAAPRGTPVYSAGDGRVLKSGYNRANGNYVFIQHGAKYVTKYLHLHKRKVRTGQRVKQKQIIGSVGSTGYSTGPHLHYEFLVNGVHRNPKTIFHKLPKARSIKSQELERFKEHIAGLSLQLETLSQEQLTQVAGK